MKRSAALLLALVIATLIGFDSAGYYFHHPMYEIGDAAANSLSVARAKHFAELYGPYSRWGFHHPGPAFFYVEALGEWLFFDVLRIVPAAFNAQALICLLVDAGFFMAALHVFTQWMPARCRWWFLPLALAVAALHFGNPTAARAPAALSAAGAFVSVWSAHLVVLTLLCLLAAGASVAAGRGEDLPLLVLAGGFLVHLHVAQPMFVIPCTLLAYAGLMASQNPPEGSPGGLPRSWWRRPVAMTIAPWRTYRRAHRLAGVLLLIFVLPLLVDAARGSQSNLAGILHHLQSYHSHHKSLLKSFLYFLQFGAYSSYQAGQVAFGKFDSAGVWRYLRANARFYPAWLAAYGLAAWVAIRLVHAWVRRRRLDRTELFLGWAGGFLFLSVALTLRWGVIQDGEMFYFNAFFNFGIYYFAALIAAAELTRWIASRRSEQGSGLLEWSLAVLATILCLAIFARQVRIFSSGEQDHLGFHNRIARLIEGDFTPDGTAPETVKFLDFSQASWPLGVGIALQLERAGEKFAVPARWRTMFGPEYPPEISLLNTIVADYRKWTLVDPPAAQSEERTGKALIPLEDGVALLPAPLTPVDPDHGGATSMEFHVNALSPALEITGWDDPESWGDWISSQRAVLAFPAAPVKGDVVLTLDVAPLLEPAHGLSAQRLRISFNGVRLVQELRLTEPAPAPIHVIIPEAVWNRSTTKTYLNALLELDLPDAVSLQALDPSSPETRTLALRVSRLSWQASGTGAPAGGASTESNGAENAALPTEYTFGSGANPPLHSQGISADGWTGPQVTLLLPRTASPAPFLRLAGVALAAPGIVYPDRFTCQTDAGAVTEAVIEAPGEFDVPVPLPAGKTAENVSVHLAFSQTFVPSRIDANSHDDRQLAVLLHRVSITSAAQPVFTWFRRGWYAPEADSQYTWRWSNAESEIEVDAEHPGTLVLTGDVRSQAPGNELDVLLDGTRFATIPALSTTAWRPVTLHAGISAGKHVWQFHSHAPAVQMPSDTRLISFELKNERFKLR